MRLTLVGGRGRLKARRLMVLGRPLRRSYTLTFVTLGVLFGLQCFFRSASDCSILIRCDNTTVVAYINKQGGSSPILCELAFQIWEFCIVRGITIRSTFLAGRRNVKADTLSPVRHSDHSYELSFESFEALREHLP